MKIKLKLVKLGPNSIGFIIPKTIRENMNLNYGDLVDIDIKKLIKMQSKKL